MGYYTDFTVKVMEVEEGQLVNAKDPTGFLSEDIDNHLEEISHYQFEWWDGMQCSINAKWYDFDNDIKKLSLIYPDNVFQVDGIGEESGDVWRMYYANGKSHSCKVVTTYSPYDPKLLK